MAEQAVKSKKKQWYPIIAPNQFNNIVLGETLVGELGTMRGKTLTQSLTSLTSDPKRYNVNIHFKIDEVDNEKAKTSVIGYEIVASSVKRFVRRSALKINLSFTCETSDNVLLRVKPLVVTKADVRSSVAAKMRHSIVQFLTKTIRKMSYGEFMNNLINYKIQSMMRGTLNKVYPLKICEIRYAGIEARGKPQEVKAEAQAENK